MPAYNENFRGWDGLMMAIVVQAKDDYERALKGRKVDYGVGNADIIREVKSFFLGDWYDALVDYKIDGRLILQRTQRDVAKWKRNQLKRRLKEAKRCSAENVTATVAKSV